MDQNLYAYTELAYQSYPGYLSINEREGKITLTVREPENGGCKHATLTVSREQLRDMAEQLLIKLGD